MNRTCVAALALLALIALPAFAAGGGPSFDCAAATAPDEKIICASPELSELDRIGAQAWIGYAPEHGDTHDIAAALLADRRACGDDAACVGAALYNALDTYVGIAALRAWVPRHVESLLLRKASNAYEPLPPDTDQPWPEKLGECSATEIVSLTDRAGRPLEQAEAYSGTVVEFSNGGSQVSYSREPALVGSQVGQDVSLCLIAIPRDCPPGDTRGRLYLGLNHFTQGTWLLSDSQHGCGGA